MLLTMKKIVIEISDEQHEIMKNFLEKCFYASLQEDCGFDGYTLKLNVYPIGSDLTVEMYGSVDLGDVKWSLT